MKYGISASQVRKSVVAEPTRVFVTHQVTPFIASYSWTNAGGWGTKSSNPATLMSGNGLGMAINKATNTSLIAGSLSTPYLHGYRITTAGFGTKYANPSVVPPTSTSPARAVYSVDFHPSGEAVAVLSSGTPYINAYAWTEASGFGTKYANPTAAAVVNPNGQALDFNGDGSLIASGHNSATASVSAYPFSVATGFGTKWTNLNAGVAVLALAITKSRSHLLLSKALSPWIEMYPFTTTAFGTKFTDPGTASTLNSSGIAISPLDDAVIMTAGTAARSYPISASGFGTAYAAAATYTGSTAFQYISEDGKTSFQGSNTTPFVYAYPFNATTGFGTRFVAPASLVAGQGNGIGAI